MNRLKRYAAVTILLVVGSYLIGDGSRELRNSWRLSHEGRTTTGKVFDNSTFRSERNTAYYLSVEFQVGKGLTLREKIEVSSGVYLKAIGSGTVTVHYLPSDPDICVAGDTVSIRFGTLLAGLGIFLAGVHLLWFFRYAGKKVAELCVEEHEFAMVDARQFKHLDFAYYEQSQRLLETHGYRFLADRERCLGVADAKVLDLESKFSNGVWVITSNAQAAGALDQPSGMDAIHLSVDTGFETLIESHGKRVASCLNRHPGVEPAGMETLEDVHRMQAELLKAKAEHRRRTGLTKPELQRISGKGPSQEMDILHDGISAGHENKKGKAA